MKKTDFMQKLIELLMILDGGMKYLTEPFPDGVHLGIMRAIVSLGDEAVPYIHAKLSESNWISGFGYTLDVLGQIGNPSSTQHIVKSHQNSNFISGASAIAALERLQTDEGYHYLSDIVRQYARGNSKVINSSTELVIACRALGNWNNDIAVQSLKLATEVQDIEGVTKHAIEALAKYATARQFLEELRAKNPELSEIVTKSLEEKDDTE